MFRRPRWVVLAAVLLAVPGIALLANDWWEAARYALYAVAAGVSLAVAYRLILRANPLALAVNMLLGIMLWGAWTLVFHPAQRPGALILAALVGAAFLWAGMGTILSRGRKPGPEATSGIAAPAASG